MWQQLRIGTGFDVHALEAGRDLWLGGLKIDHSHGLAGHSDADALLHAVVDALLGAMGEGDIGTHFPSTNEQWRGQPSSKFVSWTVDLMKKKGFSLVNLDCCVIAQEPKLSPYMTDLRQSIAKLLESNVAQVHVKATTTDHLGFTGRKEGIAVQAVCLLHRNP